VTGLDLTEHPDDFVVPHVFVGRLLLYERERAASLQPTFVDVCQRFDPLPARRRLELRDGDQLALQVVAKDSSVADERVRPAFNRVELPVVIEEPNDDRIQDEQHSRAGDSADQ